MKGNNPAKPLVRIRKYRAARNGIPLLCPPKRSRCFARFAPRLNHPPVPPAPTQQPAPFPNIANGSLYIHPFDSAKPPCPLLQSILTVKTLFHRPACAQKRFAPPAPNSAIKARFHRPDYAKKHPKHLSSASKSLLQSAPCSAHRKKHEKTRPFAPSNRLSLTDTTKEKLARSPSQATYSPHRSSPSPHDNKQSKEKAEAMPPFKLFSRHSATIGKKQKTDTLATTIKKNAPQQVTLPPDNKSRKRRNRTHSAQSRLYLPTSPLPSAPFFFAPPYFKSFAPLSNPLNAAARSALKKRSTKN